MRRILTVSAAIAAFTLAPALHADNHGAAPSLEEVLADERRAEDRARDEFRHPAETLAFFQVEPGMTVAEFAPGGGWYTRILAPYLMPTGDYIAINRDSEGIPYSSRAAEARSKGWTERFREGLAEDYGIEAEDAKAYEIDEIPEELLGTADRALIIRALHGLWNGQVADEAIARMRALLKDDGMLGIVQHRAPADAGYEDVNPARGYMREADVIKLMELHGFELVDRSEINANPRDTADHPEGVWEMKPVWRTKRPELADLGESDRMTLLFRKSN